MTFFAPIPAAFSCKLETCQPLMEIACPLAIQMNFLGFADACPARCRWASPSHQGENPQPMWRLRLISLGTVALSNIPAVSKYDSNYAVWCIFAPHFLQQLYTFHQKYHRDKISFCDTWAAFRPILRSKIWTLPEDFDSMCRCVVNPAG